MINKNKEEAKRNKILFIDASNDFMKDGNKNKLREEEGVIIVEGQKDVESLVNLGIKNTNTLMVKVYLNGYLKMNM